MEITRVMRIGRPPTPEPERFWAKVDFTSSPNGCWLWEGSTSGDGPDNQYGQFRCARRFSIGLENEYAHVRAHRWAYEFCVGPIPDGLVLDHLCCTNLCVLPDHLEPVTTKVNDARARAMVPST